MSLAVRPFDVDAGDGLRLHGDRAGSGRPLLLLHGFTGSTGSWALLRQALAGRVETIAIDLPGHGRSSAPDDARRYALGRLGGDLARVLDALAIDRAAVLGYSLGARAALRFALDCPDRVDALVLESGSPGITDAGEREARLDADRALADAIEREGIDAFVQRWEALPLWESQRHLSAKTRDVLRAERLANVPRGLANSLRGAGVAVEEPVVDRLRSLAVPTLVVAGALDAKFVALGETIAAAVPRGRLVVVERAGHAVHLERPDALADHVVAFLERAGDRARTSHRTSGDRMSVEWKTIKAYTDIRYERLADEGIAKITINRPEVRNAFRPQTVAELIDAFDHARDDLSTGVVLLTGEGDLAFCSGGDQRVRGHGGYVGADQVPRLNILDVQKQIRYLPKPVIAVVAGYAIGGGHVLHLVCDLTVAADNARFGQTGPIVGSFDAGYGAGYLARVVGHKKAREIWYLCRQYDAQEALAMGLVNIVVPLRELEAEALRWSREILAKSPTAIRFLKAAFNADTDGLAGIQQLAGDATLLYYLTEEAKEGKNAFLEKRPPDWSKFPRFP